MLEIPFLAGSYPCFADCFHIQSAAMPSSLNLSCALSICSLGYPTLWRSMDRRRTHSPLSHLSLHIEHIPVEFPSSHSITRWQSIPYSQPHNERETWDPLAKPNTFTPEHCVLPLSNLIPSSGWWETGLIITIWMLQEHYITALFFWCYT